MKEISLSRGLFAKIDDEDWNMIRGHSWYAHKGKKNKTYYAACRVTVDGKRKMVYMHRVIMQARVGEIVDHRNRDSLDNRRENLRIGNQSLNLRNSVYSRGSPVFRGVNFYPSNFKWVAKYRGIHIGYFDNEIDAALAYNAVAYADSSDWSFINKIPGLSNEELIMFSDGYVTKFQSSIYRGVYKKSKDLWQAHIQYKNNREIIGYYKTEIEAARAYNNKCDGLECSDRKNIIDIQEQVDLFL